MFSLIKKAVGYFWKSDNSTANEEDLIPEELSNLISFLQCDKEDNKENFSGAGINRANGKITHISGDYCLIDDHYYLDLRKFSFTEMLEIGTRICFSVFRLSEDEEWQINRVYSVGEETWDEGGDGGVGVLLQEEEGAVMCLEEAEKKGLAQRRSLVGKVQQREGRDVIIDPGNIRFSLDEVESNFIPLNGDWLSLEALVELDEESGDLGGKILRIVKVSALRIRFVENGEVTAIGSAFAVVNKNILAYSLSFSPGYEASVGDRVVLQAVESDCGIGCSWRAIALAPADASLQKKATITTLNNDSEEDSLLLRDKEGLVVKGDNDFGNMTLGSEGVKILQLCNEGSKMQLLIRSRFHGARAQSQMALLRSQLVGDEGRNLQDNKPVPIHPGETFSFEFHCKPRFLGNSTELFVFTFRGFRIGRHLKVRVVDMHSESLAGVCEMPGRDLYRGKNNSSRWHRFQKPNKSGTIIVPGVRPHKPPAFVPMRLPMFEVPDRLWDTVVDSGDVPQENKKSFVNVVMDIKEVVPALNCGGENGLSLSTKNYKQSFHALLHLEEIELSLRMQERDLFGVTLHPTGPGGQFLALEVPGLAEKRPSILVGDRVLLSSSSNNKYGEQRMKYEGYVHKISRAEVWLKFNATFHSTFKQLECGIVVKDNITEILEPPQLKWDVSFHFSRTPLRRCHLAVDLALTHLGEDFLFPMKIIKKKPQVYLSECREECIESENQQGNGTHEKKDWQEETNDIGLVDVGAHGKISEKCKEVESKMVTDYNVVPENGYLKLNSCSSADEANMKFVTVEEEPGDLSHEKHFSSSSSFSEISFTNNSSQRIPVIERLFGASSPSSHKSHPPAGEHCSSVGNQSVKTSNSNSLFHGNFHSDGESGTCCTTEEAFVPIHQKRTVKWFNQRLNRQQKNAVLQILKGEARPLPYVIFGPPGTGKTVTLVEAVVQILHLVPESRIMVATPSNSSADLIAERILELVPLNPGELVRLIALHCCEEGKIPSYLMPYCTTGIIGRSGMDEDILDTYNSGTKLRIPMSSSNLGRHRVTIGTCVTLGQIYALGFPKGHFTHVFLDEAGQSTEPEALIPLGFLSTSAEIGWGQAILAGDPRQLGPVVMSRIAYQLGLGKSLLARMLSSSPYAPDPVGFPDQVSGHYNPSVVTRLIVNYRSVPNLLSLTSEVFYDSSLLPTVSPFRGREGVLLLRMGKHLPLMKCDDDALKNVQIASPLIFHGVRGEESRHVDSPSWFNPMEAVQCVEYVKMLYHLADLSPCDIGIITPYVEQVKTIRNLIVDHCLPLPKVGTVEEFQGQERLAVFLSTVRTSKSQIPVDLVHALGFVSSPNRLNVATSRARALLIIIGDPYLLQHDPLWNKLIKRCIQSNSFVGCDIPSTFLKYFDNVEDDDTCDISTEELCLDT